MYVRLLSVFAVVPTVPHYDLRGVCDYGTFLNDGRRRFELLTALLTHSSNLPIIIIKGAEVTPFMIAGAVLTARPAGRGTFCAPPAYHHQPSTVTKASQST
jgi:hypothetical protein